MFGTDMKDQAGRLCELHEKVAELEKQRENYKEKAAGFEKIQFENKKLQ